MKTMKPSDLTAKEFFQLTVNSLLELCTHSIDSHRIVSIEGRLLLSLDTGDKVELNILEQDISSLLKSVKTDDTNASLSVGTSVEDENVGGELPQNTEAVPLLTEVDDSESLNDTSVHQADSTGESELRDTFEDEGDQSYNLAESLPSAVLQMTGEFMCSSCGVTMKSARAIKRHVSEHINPKLLEGSSTTLYHELAKKPHGVYQKKPKVTQSFKDGNNPWRSYVCKECGDTFTTPSHLNLHRVQLHRTYKCIKCGLVLVGRINFSQHVRTEHPGLHISKAEKSFVCEYCSRTFALESQLQDHIATVHLEAVEHRCDQCGKVLGSAITLVIHKRQLHERRLQRTCDSCGAQFTRLASLINHLTREHPHLLPDKYRQRLDRLSCKVCNMSFSRPNSLKRHTEIRHGGTPKYMCVLCSRRFSCRRYVLRHIHSHHPSIANFKRSSLVVHIGDNSMSESDTLQQPDVDFSDL